MPINYTEVLYRRTYKIHGVDVTIHMPEEDIVVRGLDKSHGIEVQMRHALVPEVKPAAKIMMADLQALELGPDDLEGQSLTMNGTRWNIVTYNVHGSPNGDWDGELYLILQQYTGA
jgi:hypothetical protein